MKKVVTFVLAVLLLTGMVCVPAYAQSETEYVWILMFTEGTEIARQFSGTPITDEQMDTAVADSVDVIPEGVEIRPGRLEVYQQREVSCPREVFDITFRIWGTVGKPLCVFFRPEGETDWVLLTCCLGDIIEPRFYGPGSYVLAVAY